MYYNIVIYNSMRIRPDHKFHIDIYFKYNTNIYTYIYQKFQHMFYIHLNIFYIHVLIHNYSKKAFFTYFDY